MGTRREGGVGIVGRRYRCEVRSNCCSKYTKARPTAATTIAAAGTAAAGTAQQLSWPIYADFVGRKTMNNNKNNKVGSRVLQQIQHACEYPVNIMVYGVYQTRLSKRMNNLLAIKCICRVCVLLTLLICIYISRVYTSRLATTIITGYTSSSI